MKKIRIIQISRTVIYKIRVPAALTDPKAVDTFLQGAETYAVDKLRDALWRLGKNSADESNWQIVKEQELEHPVTDTNRKAEVSGSALAAHPHSDVHVRSVLE